MSFPHLMFLPTIICSTASSSDLEIASSSSRSYILKATATTIRYLGHTHNKNTIQYGSSLTSNVYLFHMLNSIAHAGYSVSMIKQAMHKNIHLFISHKVSVDQTFVYFTHTRKIQYSMEPIKTGCSPIDFDVIYTGQSGHQYVKMKFQELYIFFQETKKLNISQKLCILRKI